MAICGQHACLRRPSQAAAFTKLNGCRVPRGTPGRTCPGGSSCCRPLAANRMGPASTHARWRGMDLPDACRAAMLSPMPPIGTWQRRPALAGRPAVVRPARTNPALNAASPTSSSTSACSATTTSRPFVPGCRAKSIAKSGEKAGAADSDAGQRNALLIMELRCRPTRPGHNSRWVRSSTNDR